VQVFRKAQYTSTDEYDIVEGTKKIARFYIKDPQPPIPDGWDAFQDVELGDYVLVDAETIKDLQRTKSRYAFFPDDGDILTENWMVFQEEMTIEDLGGGDNFLLYYQRIGPKNCDTKPTARALPLGKKASKRKKSDDDEDDDDGHSDAAASKAAPPKTTPKAKPAGSKRPRRG
jgi:hypothetical protein